MRFDPALAAQDSFHQSEAELGPDWEIAVELEDTFSCNAGATGRDAYERLLSLAARYPDARAFHAFCIYITWQQATEETISRHFETGLRLCETYLSTHERRHQPDGDNVAELYESFRNGLGLEEEDDIQAEYKKDTPKGGD